MGQILHGRGRVREELTDMVMRERERTRERNNYEQIIKYLAEDRKRSYTGDVVIRAKDLAWVTSRQATVKHYLWPSRYYKEEQSAALDDWNVFVQDIKVHSGMHRHQGGLVIFIIEGEGYSIVDGERHDWEAGDLLLLPMKPGGVEHQHFNKEEGKPAKWIAFISAQLFEWGASDMVQVQEMPEWKEKSRRNGRSARR
jgi:hypothetical protein